MSSNHPNDAFPKHVSQPIPGFTLGQELGRGGMGVVFRAVDVELERAVAVKLVHPAHSVHAEAVARFLEEARITGRLQHPGVPPVHRLGFQADGRPFLAMKWIDGRTLADLLWDRATPANDLSQYLQVFEQVCQTVGYAHEQGVIHRDLKPSNVMVGAFGEVQVMDWGLAKTVGRVEKTGSPIAVGKSPDTEGAPGSPVGATEGGTQEGQAVGTPAYMSPEQARGEVHHLDARTDVFALGAMLCEILTGRPPRSGPYAIVAARTADLTEAWALLDACGADAELVSLARQCLAAAPEDRPANGGVVAERMTAYRSGVEQRLRQAEQERAAAEARALEQRKRQRVQRRLTLAVVLLLAGVAGGAWYADRQVREQAFRSSTARVAMGAALDHAEKSLRADRPEEAELALAEARRRLEADGHADPDRSLAGRLADLQGQLDFLRELDRIRDRMWTLSRGNPDTRAAMGQQFADAFREQGFDLGRPGEVRDRLTDWAVREQVLGALDLWLYAERQQQPVLVALLAVLDPNAERNAWRAAVAAGNLQEQGEIAERLKAANQPPRFAAAYGVKWPREAGLRILRSGWNTRRSDLSTAFALALVLGTGDRPQTEELEEAAGYYRVCLGLRPRHAPSLNNLGNILALRKDLDGAINAYREAVAADPRHETAFYNLGDALQSAGDPEGAINAYRKATALQPRYFDAHYNLGNALRARNDLDGAIVAYREAITLDPNHAWPWNNLGLALEAKNDLDGAIDAYRKAIQLDSKRAVYHRNLGDGLKKKTDFKGAIDAYRAALAIDPAEADLFYLLGEAYLAKEDLDGAIAAYRKATTLNPEFTEAFNALGIALVGKKDLKGAIAAFRDAVACDPGSFEAHTNLGHALQDSGDLNGAIEAYRQAVAINPDLAATNYRLGQCLASQGRFAEAAAALQLSHELGGRQPDWRLPSGRRGQEVKRLLNLDNRLPRVLEGAEDPDSAVECAEFAGLCFTYRERFSEALNLYAQAFRQDPGLETGPGLGHRYNAACAALRAAEGAGVLPPDEKDRLPLRQQALAWIRAELESCRAAQRDGPEPLRSQLSILPQHMLSDPDLASVRDPEALDRLPEIERRAWRDFWADVRRTLDEVKQPRR